MALPGTLVAQRFLWPGTAHGLWATEGALTVIVARTVRLVWRIVRGSFDGSVDPSAQGSMASAQ